MTQSTEVDRLRGAIREALTYADRDDESEAMAKVWTTLTFALEDHIPRERDSLDVRTLVDEMTSDDLWRLIFSLMKQVRESDAWKESVNRSRRADRARADAAEAEVRRLRALLDDAEVVR